MQTAFRILQATLAFCLAMTPWLPASACSRGEEYVRTSSFEMVQMADAIVVATALEGRAGEPTGQILYEVIDRVKGEVPARLELDGTLEKPGAVYGYSSCGGDQRRRKGERYLLFLQRDEDGRLQTAFNGSFDDENLGEDNVWMRIVRRYVAIQASAAPMDQLSLLKRMLQSRRGPGGEALGKVEIAELKDHLGRISPDKPTPFLLAAYAALDRGKTPSNGLHPSAADAERSDAEAAARFAKGKTRKREFAGAEARRLKILTALVNGDHPEARPLFDRIAAQNPDNPARIGLALRFFAKQGSYDRAFEWIETRLMALLPRLDKRAAQRLLENVDRVQDGNSSEGQERWRQDPRASRVWPELAFSLYRYQVERFGDDDARDFPDAVAAIPHEDYRARPPLTLALADNYDEAVHDWAVAELRDEQKRRAWEVRAETLGDAADPARLPMQVLLSTLKWNDPTLQEEMFCQSERRRLLFLREMGDIAGQQYGPLIARISVSALSNDERETLQASMARWKARIWPDEPQLDLALLLIGQKSKVPEPIVCP